ncbi:DNA recombination protein RmuC [Paracoccus seriniphilus]|uniref:DNA recombination protein RmuC homolog n=1 Tax=Paracoccus seriniphilus TaxID=184748 RepID=A0A239PS44_9RHOB|nr:DNA recombination protein RmuC [Paracoccus seriniphilus]WCR12861.1 DNA recombination protein RmuC [Paracoccus seriniphilus]SNT72716.1 DNA recombination protein RmuC [Paracoccus seriniphilus]
MQFSGAELSGWLSDVTLLQCTILALATLSIGLWFAKRRWQRLAAESLENLSDLQKRLHDLDLQSGRQEIRLETAQIRQAELLEEKDGLADALHQARQQLAELQTELAESELTAAKDREVAEREIETLKALREDMRSQFKALAHETLQVQRRDMQMAQGEQLQALLTPFRDQVNRFQTELQARNKVLDEESARLREQILTLHQRSEAISQEAVNLTRALKGQKQMQGAWGEMVLERILEDSGLEAGIHYETQSSWRDENGKMWRPDVIVRMPRKKIMVIDSKVSLNDYEISVNNEEPALAAAALRRHVAALRSHITTLAEKGYHRMDDNSVDYVLMFIPIEGAFSDALRHDPTLASFALERGIGLTTPTTLMLTLRTVEHIWAVDRRESNASEIARRAGALYDKVAGFVDSMEGVGRALDQAGRAHAQAMDRLSRGSGNVIRQVEMLRELGARTQKQIGLDHDRSDGPESLPPQEAAE